MKQTNLVGWTVSAVKAPPQPVMGGADGNGGLSVEEQWALVFSEKGAGNQIQFVFGREVRDHLVRELTGGIVLHGGELPSL